MEEAEIRRWLKSVGCLVLLFLCTGCGFGWEERAVRSGTVQGQLTSTTGQPITSQPVLFDHIEVPGVAVFEDKGIQTGSQGNYAIELSAGLYDIRVHDPNTPDGWQRQRVTVVSGQVTQADFTIERSILVPHLGQVPHCDEAIPAPTHALGTSLSCPAMICCVVLCFIKMKYQTTERCVHVFFRTDGWSLHMRAAPAAAVNAPTAA